MSTEPATRILHGNDVELHSIVEADIDSLLSLRESSPAALERWPQWSADDIGSLVDESNGDGGWWIVIDGDRVGFIQHYEEPDPEYRHAGMDIFIVEAGQGRGAGTDAVRTLARHLIDDIGHHRLIIDPAADNAVAIRCYEKVGFQPVGVMRAYERGADGSFHDCLLMDLLADELA
jgi:aminoglycoside 6'-N-acetyltransferase